MSDDLKPGQLARFIRRGLHDSVVLVLSAEPLTGRSTLYSVASAKGVTTFSQPPASNATYKLVPLELIDTIGTMGGKTVQVPVQLLHDLDAGGFLGIVMCRGEVGEITASGPTEDAVVKLLHQRIVELLKPPDWVTIKI